MKMTNDFYKLTTITIIWLITMFIIMIFIYIAPITKSLQDKSCIISLSSGIVTTQQFYTKQHYSNKNSTIKPYLAILITDLGLNSSATNTAINLPAEISLGFSPYAQNIVEFLRIASKKKHDLLINIPMKFKDPFQDAGSLASSPYQSLDMVINNYSKYILGIYTDSGEIFSNDNQEMEMLLSKLYTNNLLVCYSGHNPQIEVIAKNLGMNFIKPHFIIDNEFDENMTKNQFITIKNQVYGKNEKFLLSIYGSISNLNVLSELLVVLQTKFIIVPIGVLFE